MEATQYGLYVGPLGPQPLFQYTVQPVLSFMTHTPRPIIFLPIFLHLWNKERIKMRVSQTAKKCAFFCFYIADIWSTSCAVLSALWSNIFSSHTHKYYIFFIFAKVFQSDKL